MVQLVENENVDFHVIRREFLDGRPQSLRHSPKTEELSPKTEGFFSGTEELFSKSEELFPKPEGFFLGNEELFSGTEGVLPGNEELFLKTEGFFSGTEGLFTETEGFLARFGNNALPGEVFSRRFPRAGLPRLPVPLEQEIAMGSGSPNLTGEEKLFLNRQVAAESLSVDPGEPRPRSHRVGLVSKEDVERERGTNALGDGRSGGAPGKEA